MADMAVSAGSDVEQALSSAAATTAVDATAMRRVVRMVPP
jgi:hypothetical protein